jgi:hypothetical protein
MGWGTYSAKNMKSSSFNTGKSEQSKNEMRVESVLLDGGLIWDEDVSTSRVSIYSNLHLEWVESENLAGGERVIVWQVSFKEPASNDFHDFKLSAV